MKKSDYYAEGSNGKNTHYARTGRKYEQRHGNPKNQKEVLEIKNTVADLKNASDGLISRLDMAKKRISEHEDILTKRSNTENQRKKILKKK